MVVIWKASAPLAGAISGAHPIACLMIQVDHLAQIQTVHGYESKQAVLEAKETGTVFLNQQSRPALRALRTERTAELEPLGKFEMGEHMANLMQLYFGGDMEAAIPLSGQVAGRIDAVKPAREIVEETVREFHATLRGLAAQYTQA